MIHYFIFVNAQEAGGSYDLDAYVQLALGKVIAGKSFRIPAASMKGVYELRLLCDCLESQNPVERCLNHNMVS